MRFQSKISNCNSKIFLSTLFKLRVSVRGCVFKARSGFYSLSDFVSDKSVWGVIILLKIYCRFYGSLSVIHFLIWFC